MAALGLLAAALLQDAQQRQRADAAAPTRYTTAVRVDPAAHTAEGTLTVTARNVTGMRQDRLYFHLYANRFRDESKLQGADWQLVLGPGHQPGRIDVSGVKVNGLDAAFQVNDTVLDIPLPQGWKPDQTVSISMGYRIVMPKNNLRLSYDEHALWFGNWLPIVAAYDKNGWNLDPYYAVGDPFYSGIGDYDVSITVPKGFKAASTGVEGSQKGREAADGSLTYRVSAERVRDFSFVVMDAMYAMVEGKAGDITVRTWYRQTDNIGRVKLLQDVAEKSLDYFSKAYGPYPYKEYDVIRTGGYFGGMEYPGLVYIQSAFYNNDNPFGLVAVAHETAHQWWYGMVGNNEVKEPWLDESLTNYATLRFLLDRYPSVGQFELARRQKDLANALMFEQKRESVAMPVNEFSSNTAYTKLVYTKGPEMFYRLEQAIGVERMNRVLAKYWQDYKYKVATGGNLIGEFERELGLEATTYFDTWLHGGTAAFQAKAGK